MTQIFPIARVLVLMLGALLALPAQAQDPQKPVPGQQPDQKIIVGLMECLADGLVEGWKKAWFTIKEIRRNLDGTRQYEARFRYTTTLNDKVGTPFEPCGTSRIVDGVLALNDYLQPSQRRWTSMTMTFNIDSSFDATYEFAEPKPDPAAAPAKAAPKPAAKKKSETAK